ncbi:MAG: cph1 3 [Marmoricola sp.]|nr:cph1 3 [Marmoricola sp.]
MKAEDVTREAEILSYDLLERAFDGHRELRASHDRLDESAGQVSHELQGPLASVDLVLEMLAEKEAVRADSELTFLVSAGRRSVGRMGETILDLMDYATRRTSAPLGVPVVVVRAEAPAGAQGERVRVTVTDNGPGVRAEERESIFELMSRGTSDVDGHGIGLATCSAIIEAHGGTLGVEPAPGGGACFWFELPTTPAQPGPSVPV